jgi:hypothetical protein
MGTSASATGGARPVVVAVMAVGRLTSLASSVGATHGSCGGMGWLILRAPAARDRIGGRAAPRWRAARRRAAVAVCIFDLRPGVTSRKFEQMHKQPLSATSPRKQVVPLFVHSQAPGRTRRLSKRIRASASGCARGGVSGAPSRANELCCCTYPLSGRTPPRRRARISLVAQRGRAFTRRNGSEGPTHRVQSSSDGHLQPPCSPCRTLAPCPRAPEAAAGRAVCRISRTTPEPIALHRPTRHSAVRWEPATYIAISAAVCSLHADISRARRPLARP